MFVWWLSQMLTACEQHKEDSSCWSSGAGLQKNHASDGVLSKYSFDTILWAVFNFMVKQDRRSHLTTKTDEKPKVIFFTLWRAYLLISCGLIRRTVLTVFSHMWIYRAIIVARSLVCNLICANSI